MNDIYEVSSGADYVPISKQSKFTKGRITQFWSDKTGRIHYFWSKLMEDVFYIFEYASEVKDIREAFPLINIEQVLPEEEKLLMEHYRNSKTGDFHKLTTTYLITLIDGRSKAISVKYAGDLKKKESVRYVHLQECFWKDYYGIDFGIVTEKEIDKNVINNLKNIREHQSLQDEYSGYEISMIDEIIQKHLSIKEYCQDKKIEHVKFLSWIKWMVSNHEIKCDLKVPLNIETRLYRFVRR